MRKTTTILTALCASVITACSGTTTEQADVVSESNDAATQTISVEDNKEDVTVPEDVPEETSLYEKFLNNEASMHINIENDHGYYFSFSESEERDFTIEELTNFLIEELLAMQVDARILEHTIEYAYIDCGNDGNNELALYIHTPTSGEDWKEYFIIKEIDGKLESIYSNVAWSRSHIAINEYGFIAGYGSGGASLQGFNKEYIDADGKWHYLYENTAEGRPDVCGVLSEADINPDYCLYFSFDLNNTPDDPSDDYDTYSFTKAADPFEEVDLFKANYYCPIIYDDSIYEDAYPLKSYFDSYGVTIYTMTEIENMIEEKEAQEGVTETIRNGKEAVWTNLDYSFEPYIANYNDDNFLGIKEYFPRFFSLHYLRMPENGSTTLRLKADGAIEGQYSMFQYSQTSDSISEKNSYTAKFSVIDKISDTVYSLKLSDIQLEYEPGSGEVTTPRTGSTIVTTYVEPIGLDDGGVNYILYTPGTAVSEIEDRVFDAFNDYMKDKYNSMETIDNYILFETDGNNYVWTDM